MAPPTPTDRPGAPPGPASDDVDDAPGTLDGLDLTTTGIAEMLPGVLPPIRWGVASYLVEEAFRRLLDGLDALPDDVTDGERRLIRRVRGRAALDFRCLADLAAALPGSAAEELERQYFGSRRRGRPAAAAGPVRHGRFRAARHDLLVSAVRSRAVVDAEVVIAAVRALDALPVDTLPVDAGRGAAATSPTRRIDVESLRGGDAGADGVAAGDAEAAAALLRLIDLSCRAMAAELAVAADAAALYRRMELTLARRLDPDTAGRLAGRLTARVPAPPPSPHASAAVFGGPTWEERGGRPVHAAARPDAPARTDAPEPSALDPEVVDELRAALLAAGRTRPDGWRGRLYLRSVRRLAVETTGQLARREATKAAVLALGGHTRRQLQSIGATLAGDGRLPGADAVELLTPAELFAVLRGGPVPAGPVLEARRTAIELAEAAGPLPVRFSGVPSATAPRPVTVDGHRLEGWAAGPGRVEGIARVVRDPLDEFDDDEILVATVTDPSWTPLFARAAAVVLERGGPLSHAAVLARELGLPAVLDVAGATAVLDGRRVVVDGDHGVVTVVDDDHGVVTVVTEAG